jgi:hypothetical protein
MFVNETYVQQRSVLCFVLHVINIIWHCCVLLVFQVYSSLLVRDITTISSQLVSNRVLRLINNHVHFSVHLLFVLHSGAFTVICIVHTLFYTHTHTHTFVILLNILFLSLLGKVVILLAYCYQNWSEIIMVCMQVDGMYLSLTCSWHPVLLGSVRPMTESEVMSWHGPLDNLIVTE